MILSARGISARWDASCGHLPSLVIDGSSVLWSAPWRSDPRVQADPAIPMVDRRLAGTFVCAPFGRDDGDDGPPHGWSANAPWRMTRAGPDALTAVRRLSRGHVTARIALRNDHPVLYQTHMLDFDRPCTFAHHPMFALSGGGTLTANCRATLTFAAETPVLPQASRWDGLAPELREYPKEKAEDFATLIGPIGLGWTALARHAEGDTLLTLRRAEQLPVTNIWISNGARGDHWSAVRGLLGIEDAICAGAGGFAAALTDNRVKAEGVATALPPGRHVIPHAIVRIAGVHEVRDVRLGDGHLAIHTDGADMTVPFAREHFK
ncbi:hypothetical protein [Jannaschia rubra]|uniref:hypothetical protein n=1 Tax=Jannaschia rubra TaxID=282197 RepID=UPI0024916737|nr:hypothetical protein [Jannaschia rubra]